jgi:hypothetical protein
MSGVFNGVQAKVRQQHAPKTFYIHCHAHKLDLVMIQSINRNKQIFEFSLIGVVTLRVFKLKSCTP